MSEMRKSLSPSPSPGPPLWESALRVIDQERSRSSVSPQVNTKQWSAMSSALRQSWGWSGNSSPIGPPRGADSQELITSRALGAGPEYPPWLYGGSGMDLMQYIHDPFPSMWCSALFLHVHPKKQVMSDLLTPYLSLCPFPLLPSVRSWVMQNAAKRNCLVMLIFSFGGFLIREEPRSGLEVFLELQMQLTAFWGCLPRSPFITAFK